MYFSAISCWQMHSALVLLQWQLPRVHFLNGLSLSISISIYISCFSTAMQPMCVWIPLQQLESLVWERTGNLFVSSHNDGGYSVWPVTSGNTCSHQPVTSTIPYGEKCTHSIHFCVPADVKCMLKHIVIQVCWRWWSCQNDECPVFMSQVRWYIVSHWGLLLWWPLGSWLG